MKRLAYTIALIIAAVIGFNAAWFVPVYGSPFVGCTEGLLSLNPNCGAWPESLRNVLLVAPTAILIRTVPLLLGYIIVVIVLGCFGGLVGIEFGDHFVSLSEPAAIFNNLYLHFIPSLCAVLILCIGFFLNRAYIDRAV